MHPYSTIMLARTPKCVLTLMPCLTISQRCLRFRPRGTSRLELLHQLGTSDLRGRNMFGGTMTYDRKFATLIASLIAVVCGALMPTRTLAACDAATIAGSYGYRLNAFFASGISHAFHPIGSFVPGVFAGRIVFDSTTIPPSISGSRVWNAGGG